MRPSRNTLACARVKTFDGMTIYMYYHLPVYKTMKPKLKGENQRVVRFCFVFNLFPVFTM